MRTLKKTWNFLWNDDSIWSWLANIVVAFLVIRYILYPMLGLVLGTPFPIVAVVSESMEHGLHQQQICGKTLAEFQESFSNYWDACGEWYINKGIDKSQFQAFPLRDGFNKGDVIILWRAEEIKTGDILVFEGHQPQPIIHRVVGVFEVEGKKSYQTKGDHNSDSISSGLDEQRISSDRLYGKGIIRIPYLGWVKILFVDAVKPLGITIER
ncbi:signal peptidase I [Candidatus Woesearchaeota archaeon]|nr:signal peptidase I [Candidatus Woesearchaeota archaeon]